MKKILSIVMILMSVSACSSFEAQSTDLAQLYTGHEQGSWYKFSPATCSAELCPAY